MTRCVFLKLNLFKQPHSAPICVHHRHRKMPRGRMLTECLHNDLIAIPEIDKICEHNAICQWTASAMTRLTICTSDFTLEQSNTKTKTNTSSVDLVEDMRNCAGCSYLIARAAALRCSVCRCAYYCSRSCQRKSWKTHKATCGQTSKFTRRVFEAHQTVFRHVWSLHCAWHPCAGRGPYYFTYGQDGQEGFACLLYKCKPKTHPRNLTVLLMSRGDEHDLGEDGVHSTIKISFLNPVTLLSELKDILRDTMTPRAQELMQEVSDGKKQSLRLFRNKIIAVINLMKEADEQQSPNYHTFIVMAPFWHNTGFEARMYKFPMHERDNELHCVQFSDAFSKN